MTTRITVTTGDGGLLERNAQQQAAARQAALVKAQAEQAAATGAEQQRQRRIASGLDPATGRPLPSAGSTSRLTRIDQEPAAFRKALGSYLFLPVKTGNTWKVKGPNSREISLDYIQIKGPEPSLRLNGGPYLNSPALRYTSENLGEDYSNPWSTLITESNTSIISPKSGGLTFEFYADFGSDGDGFGGSIIECSIVGAQQQVFDGYIYSPFIHLGVEVSSLIVESGQVAFSSITQYVRYNPTAVPSSIFSTNSLIKTLSTSFSESVTNNLGWQHFACEAYIDGRLKLYHNGMLVSEKQDSILTQDFLQSLVRFNPAWVFFVQNGQRGRPYMDLHGVRYSPFLRYKGNNFTPPVIR